MRWHVEAAPGPGPPAGEVVAAQGAGVVLELEEMELAAAEEEQVDLLPFALAISELHVRPGTERGHLGHQGSELVEPLGLVRVRRRGDLDPPPERRRRHGAHRGRLRTCGEGTGPIFAFSRAWRQANW